MAMFGGPLIIYNGQAGAVQDLLLEGQDRGEDGHADPSGLEQGIVQEPQQEEGGFPDRDDHLLLLFVGRLAA